MNSNQNLNILSQALKESVNSIGGEDAAMEACDRMYSASFRDSNIMLFSELDESEQSEIIQSNNSIVFYQNTKIKAPEFSDDEHEDSYYAACDSYYDQIETWCEKNKDNPELKIPLNEPCVWLCNYKGESDNVELLRNVKDLPIFKSKRESFFQVN